LTKAVVRRKIWKKI